MWEKPPTCLFPPELSVQCLWKIVATVPVRRDGPALGLARELVAREDTEVVEVTKANRDLMREEMVEKLSCPP